MSLSAHQKSTSTLLTQVTFATGDNGGDTLGEIMAAGGQDGARYEAYLKDRDKHVAFLSGPLNALQQNIIANAQATTSVSTREEMQALQRANTGKSIPLTLEHHVQVGTFDCD